ncbi:MAG TPA: O-antigen ligase family protein [Stellaceae bacterium]|nr:O-antigen ligase family protein [Stellaceae bacterium]
MEKRFRLRAAGTVLPGTAIILPPLTLFAPLGAAPVLVVAALALLALDWRRCREGVAASMGLAVLLIALGLWGTASATWSIIPGHSFFEGVRFLAESIGGLAITGAALAAPPAERRRVAIGLTIGVGLALGLMTIERFAGMPLTHLGLGLPFDTVVPLTRFDRGLTVLVLALWPALLAQPGWWRRLLLMTAVLALALTMLSVTAILATLLGIAIFAAAYFAPRLVAGAMIAGLVTLAIAIPVATPSDDQVLALRADAPWIKASAIHRLLIWRFGADHVAERPLLGWGMDSSRALPGGKTDLNVMLPTLHYGGPIEAMPLHPHDAALQWQLELGVPGLALSLAIVSWILYRVGWQAPLARDRRAGALALTGAALLVGLLSFGVWQAWWQSTLWLVAALYAAVGETRRAP